MFRTERTATLDREKIMAKLTAGIVKLVKSGYKPTKKAKYQASFMPEGLTRSWQYVGGSQKQLPLSNGLVWEQEVDGEKVTFMLSRSGELLSTVPVKASKLELKVHASLVSKSTDDDEAEVSISESEMEEFRAFMAFKASQA